MKEFRFKIKTKRPEEIYRDVFEYFNDEQAFKYSTSKSMMKTQEKITLRALEILNIKKNEIVLDAGCGCGFSSIVLKELGFNVVSIDIVKRLLFAYQNPELNPILADMRFPPFKEAAFKAIISISALQWIYTELNNPIMEKNLVKLMEDFYRILKPQGKIVFQFYPKNDQIMDRIGSLFKRSNFFSGKYIIDNLKNPRKRKIFLFLTKLNEK